MGSTLKTKYQSSEIQIQPDLTLIVALIHHTDSKREWAYDRKSYVGKLDKALNEAHQKHCLIIDMATDWKQIYNFQPKSIKQTEWVN